MAARRLMREWQDLQRNARSGIVLQPSRDDDLSEWDALLEGPPDTPYEGGLFRLKLVALPSYPIAPPKVRMITRICHPNIHFKSGEICLDILGGRWSPAWTLESVCLAVQVLLADPDESSPLNCDAGNLLRCGDRRGYRSLVRMYTRLYATPAQSAAPPL